MIRLKYYYHSVIKITYFDTTIKRRTLKKIIDMKCFQSATDSYFKAEIPINFSRHTFVAGSSKGQFCFKFLERDKQTSVILSEQTFLQIKVVSYFVAFDALI